MTAIIVILAMIVFGLIVDAEECKEKGKISGIIKLYRWWYSKIKSSKVNWMIWVSVVIVLYFLTIIIFIK